MAGTIKKVVLVGCLFTFLLIVLGGGLRLNPGGAFVAAVTGTPLLIYAFNRLLARPRERPGQPIEREIVYDRDPSTLANPRRT